MGFFNFLTWILRWVIFWPFVVVGALNIENAVTGKWLSTLLSDNAGRIPPMIAEAYSAITSPWVTSPLLFLGGILTWDILHYCCRRMDRPGSRFERWVLRNKAGQVSLGFKKNGWFRKITSKTNELQEFNKYLLKFELPLVPHEFLQEDDLNKIFGEYTSLISQGKNEVGVVYLEKALSTATASAHSPLWRPSIAAYRPH